MGQASLFKRFPELILALAALALALTAGGCSAPGTPLRSDKERALAYLNSANAFLMDGDPTTALEQALLAEKCDPSIAQVHHTMALIYVEKHYPAKALAEARRAVELDPTDPAASNTLGKLLMDAGKPDEAIKPLTASAENPLYHESYKPWTNLGILYYRRTQLARASQCLNRAIEASPQLACIAYYYRGHIDLQKGLLKGAIMDYDRATRGFCAGFAEAHLALGIAYERNRSFDKARQVYLDIEDRFATSPVAEQAMRHLRKLP